MMVVAAAFTFAACGEPEATEPGPGPEPTGKKLATPVLKSEQTETSFTITWDAVTGADSYIVNFDGKNNNVTECTFTVEDLNAGDYTVRVKAQGAGYEDSDNAKIVVTLTGLTSVDWFTQTVSLPENGTVIDEENGTVVNSYDAFFFDWKGTGVTDLKFVIFETAGIPATQQEIVANMNDGNAVLASVNGEEGYHGVVGQLYGSTSYTIFVKVKNGEGQEFFTSNEIKTGEVVVPEITKAWLGSYSAYTEKIVDFEAETDNIKDQRTDFTFDVELIEGTANEVWVYGLSIIPDTPAYGVILPAQEGDETFLCLMNMASLYELNGGYVAAWLAYCAVGAAADDLTAGHTFVTGEYYAMVFQKSADGTIEYKPGNGQLSDERYFEVAAFDVVALNMNEGTLGFLQDNEGNGFVQWKLGEVKDVTKTNATPSVNNAPAKQLELGKVLPYSVVAY